ncbi:MAG: hypothetical protein AMXMBFR58_12780 [Phycisphaerae bacterium]|nr:hypothetical protein [Phycisphaerales bacterium]
MTPSIDQTNGISRLPSPIRVEVPGETLEDVVAAFHLARAEVASLFAAIGLDPSKTRETARALGINRGLAWRISRMVRESDPAAAASDVPGTASMARLFNACRERGVSESALAATAAAFTRFESALSACTGDRKTLAMLMANLSTAHDRSETEKARRTLFEGACGVWGVQAQTRFVTVFLYPSASDPTMLDAGHVTGYVGFRRLSSKPWPLSYEAVHKSTGEAERFVKEPLDPVGFTEGQLQLIKAFCSPTTPDIEVVTSNEYKRFELAAGPVGNQGLTTCVFGTRLRSIYPRYSDTPNTAGFMVILTTPTERVLFDFFVHRDLGNAPVRTHLLDRLSHLYGNIESEFERQSLPLAEQARQLPRGAAGTMCHYIPWYTKLIEFVTERIGHDVNEFTGSRFEMNYPPISTTLSRRIDLHPQP